MFFCCGSFSNLVLMSRHTPFKAHFSDKCPIIMAIEKSRTEHYDSLPTYCIRGWERQERVCWDPLNLCHSVVASPTNWFCTFAYCFTSSAQCVVSLSKPLVVWRLFCESLSRGTWSCTGMWCRRSWYARYCLTSCPPTRPTALCSSMLGTARYARSELSPQKTILDLIFSHFLRKPWHCVNSVT